MYYRRPPRRSSLSYLLPFLVILLMFAAVVFGWKTLNTSLIEQNRTTLDEKVYLNIEGGSAKAMTVGKSEWQNAPDKIYLYRGERLKTGLDGRVTLTFSDKSITRMNTNTEVSFTSLKKKGESREFEVNLTKGDLWGKVEEDLDAKSNFAFTTDLITVDTRGAVMAISAPGTVYMISGSAQVGVKYDDEVIKTYTVGVGQQLVVTPATVQSIRRGESVETLFALSDPFKRTNWYLWNTKKDGAIAAFEESDLEEFSEPDLMAEEDFGTEDALNEGAGTDAGTAGPDPITNIERLVYVTKPTKGLETASASVAVEGKFDAEKIASVWVNGKKANNTADGKWSMEAVKLLKEGENEIKIEAEDMAGNRFELESRVVIYDKSPPEAPAVTEPLGEGEFISINTIEQEILGTVSKDTQAVIVNDYRLAKYVPGSGEFTYFAKVDYGNLQAGENEFKVIAEDKAGNQSEPTIIILMLSEEDYEAAMAEAGKETTDPSDDAAVTGNKSSGEEESLPPASSAGGVKILEPNGGESFMTKETEFEIVGQVPMETAKVSVNDYFLSLYEPGNTTFNYRAYKSIGNLEIGAKNVYVAKAFDEAGVMLGQASITIDVESGDSGAPVITMPTGSATYSTTLDTLVIGGTVGKWVTRLYVNDKEIKEYIPGSEKWKLSVKLDPGVNTFTVRAEKAGIEVGESSIDITFNQ